MCQDRGSWANVVNLYRLINMHCYIVGNFIAEFGEAYVTITCTEWRLRARIEIKETRSLLRTSFLWVNDLRVDETGVIVIRRRVSFGTSTSADNSSQVHATSYARSRAFS